MRTEEEIETIMETPEPDLAQIPQGPSELMEAKEFVLLTNYVQALHAAQRSLRLLVDSAVVMFLPEQVRADLLGDAHYTDVAVDEIKRLEAKYRLDAHLKRVAALQGIEGSKPHD